MKRIISVLITIISLSTMLLGTLPVKAASYTDTLKSAGFSEGYITKLEALHKAHPNWNFVPFKTGLDFQTAVNGERSKHRNQIIEKGKDGAYYCACSNCKKNGSYVTQYANCYSASEWAVMYYMDPRNWLDEKHIFQFESNLYNGAHTQAGVESIISSTWMHNSIINYINTFGGNYTATDSNGKAVKYSKAIMEAASSNNISAYYLASRIIKEVGSKSPTASGTAGNKSPFTGIYNYYSIGATSGGMSGLEWASGYLMANKNTTLYSGYNTIRQNGEGTATSIASGQRMTFMANVGNYYYVKLYSGTYTTNGAMGYVPVSALRTTYFTYMRPWITPYHSILGGAQYIAASFLKHQYTSYLEKFNVNSSSGSLYNHEYMQNVDAPSAESVSKYNAYSKAGQLSTAKTFYIPVFNNMPADTSTPEGALTGVSTNPNKVTGVTVKGTSVNSISLKWDKIEGATHYEIKVKNLSTKKSFKKTVENVTSAKLKGLSKGVQYKLNVRAYTDGWGKYSKGIKARCVPSKVKLKSVKAKGKTIVTSWKKVKGASGYEITYSRNPQFTDIVATRKLSVKHTTYKGSGFTKGNTYYVKVRAFVKVKNKRFYGKYSTKKEIVV